MYSADLSTLPDDTNSNQNDSSIAINSEPSDNDPAPTVTTPIVSGIAQVGHTLTASATATPADDTLTFDWFSSVNNFASPIATGPTFTVTAIGVTLEVEVIATNANGLTATATSGEITTVTGPIGDPNIPHVPNSNIDEWLLADGQWAASAQPGSIPSGYQIAGIGDLAVNGKSDVMSDVLVQNPTTGDIQEWLMANTAWAGTVDLGVHPTDYRIAGIGDFFGNGIDDVLWTSAPSSVPSPSQAPVQTDIWELNSSGQWRASVSPGSHPGGYNVVGVGDFTGNGTSDILWQNPTTGDVDEWQIANGQWANSVDLGSHPGSGWSIAGVGDFFGNGIDDILWTNPGSGPNGDTEVDIWELGSNGHWIASVSPGLGLHPPGYQVAAIGDFTGNGNDGVLWYDPSTGNVDEWVLDLNGQWAASIDLGSHPGNFQIAGSGSFFSGNVTSDILWHSSP